MKFIILNKIYNNYINNLKFKFNMGKRNDITITNKQNFKII